MAFNRSARFVSSIRQTPPAVGPGSYDSLELFKKPRDPDGLYAFLSSAKRNTLSTTKDAIYFPGPGAYNVKEFQKHIPGGCSIDFTDSRSKYYVQDGPGPTDYKLPDNLFKQSTQKHRSHPGIWRGAPGSLYVGPPPRSMMVGGVSVPTLRDANGYDINEFGFLVKNPPNKYEPTLFYNIPREEANFITVRYKGNFWSRMTGREDKKAIVGPGPGEYNLEVSENPGKLLAEKFREFKRMSSNQPRYIEAVYRKNQREGTPAPNAYANSNSPFDSKKMSCECQNYIFKPPPFGQGAKRFVNVINDNPAPGTYDPMKKQSCVGSVIAVPFGSLSSRFNADNKTSIPDPGQYFSAKDGLAYEACKRCKRNYVKAGFNSSASRIPKSMTSESPPPNIYPLKMNWKIPKTSVHHSVFKSTTKRFKSLKRESVPPNAYDVIPAFKACHEPCQFLNCPEDAPFNSKQIRMPEVPDWLDTSIPGPGLTDTRGDISENVKGGCIAYGQRFEKEITETGPGPQHYCLHPYTASSILQRHFNVTLGKPNVLKDLEPQKVSWARQLRMKKRLHTFNKNVVENYKFCNPHDRQIFPQAQ